VQFCERESLSATLPFIVPLTNIGAKRWCFQKPLFRVTFSEDFSWASGEKFVKAIIWQICWRWLTRNCSFDNWMTCCEALETDFEIRVAPRIGEGMRVKIKNGPLRGIEGWVEQRYGMNTVLLRLDSSVRPQP